MELKTCLSLSFINKIIQKNAHKRLGLDTSAQVWCPEHKGGCSANQALRSLLANSSASQAVVWPAQKDRRTKLLPLRPLAVLRTEAGKSVNSNKQRWGWGPGGPTFRKGSHPVGVLTDQSTA